VRCANSSSLSSRAASAARDPEEVTKEAEVLRYRQIPVEIEPLRHVADPGTYLAWFFNDIVTCNPGPPRRWAQDPDKHPDRSGLARAVWTDEPKDLAWAYQQIQTCHCHEATETAREPGCFYCCTAILSHATLQ